jgi:hypothetical protein
MRSAWLLLFAALPVVAQTLPAGWTATGKAAWSVENKEIVGRQGPNGEPGDLWTERKYTNFEFEAEYKMKFPGNSGIWFRYQGPKTGCQADILDQPDEPGVLDGSIYCIGPKFIAMNKDAKSVVKGGWNKIRMTVNGRKIEVMLNGKMVAVADSDVFLGPGQLGVQVHAGAQFAGMEIRLRNIRIKEL